MWRSFFNRKLPRTGQRPRPRARLHLEALEARYVLSGSGPPSQVSASAPVAHDDLVKSNDLPLLIIGVLANDTDPNGSQHLLRGSVSVVTPPQFGQVSTNPAGPGMLSYWAAFSDATLLPGTYTDSFQYVVTDDLGYTSAPATVTVEMGWIYGLPGTATGVAYGQPLPYPVAAEADGSAPVTVNVLSDPRSIGMAHYLPDTVRVAAAPLHGSATADPNTGLITYTAGAGYVGSDSLLFTFQDTSGQVYGPFTENVTVHAPPVVPPPSPPANAPVAHDDLAIYTSNFALTLDLLANDTDPKGNQHLAHARVTVITPHTQQGNFVFPGPIPEQPGLISYTVGPHEFRQSASYTDTLQYVVTDDLGYTSAPATVTVVVQHGWPDVINDDAATTDGSAPVTIDVLANDSAPQGTHLLPATVRVLSGPHDGSAAVDPITGQITYTPNPGFLGTDSLLYTVQADDGTVYGPATVSVLVGPATGSVYNGPQPLPTFATTTGTAPVTIHLMTGGPWDGSQLLPGTVRIVSGPQNGSATVDPNSGLVTYTPNPGSFGKDSFLYTVQETNGKVYGPLMVNVTDNPAAGTTGPGTSAVARRSLPSGSTRPGPVWQTAPVP